VALEHLPFADVQCTVENAHEISVPAPNAGSRTIAGVLRHAPAILQHAVLES
jgi:hypothetical protein